MNNEDEIPVENVEEEDDEDNVAIIRALFTYGDKLIIPDRGKINFTITVDSASEDFPFTISDADGNLLGDGVIANLDFDIESYHINQQPDTP